MHNCIKDARKFLQANGIDCLLVNSTNEFLVEYNELNENSRYNLTGFSGSAGDALLTKDKLYLFVDGRYHVQADNEVDKNIVTVVKLQTGQNFLDELINFIKEDSIVGIFSRKTSYYRYEILNNKLAKKNCQIKFFGDDPFSVTNREPMSNTISIDSSITGLDADEKLSIINSILAENEGFLVTNLEDISYLFNLRNFTYPFSSKIKAKAVITSDESKFFPVEKMDEYEEFIRNFEGKMFVDKASISLYDWFIVKDKAELIYQNPITKMKSTKNQSELNHYRLCFERTDKTMFAIREFIEKNDNLSEYDIAKKLEEYFYNFGAKNLSFRPIVAIDKNSALVHYSKTDKNTILKDGSLVLIDCGAYYEGGLATDITRVFVKGKPTDLQKKVYTTVLKMFLGAFYYPLYDDVSGLEIDAKARNIACENEIEGFEFNHGLGHGIGINVHEYPPSLSTGELANAVIEDNMCFTIEPGLYNPQYFGVRLENSCYSANREIHSFTNMCFEKKLIDYSLLSETEISQLEKFEVL